MKTCNQIFLFQRLQSVTPEFPEELCEAALSDENKKKNRNPKIHPSMLFI